MKPRTSAFPDMELNPNPTETPTSIPDCPHRQIFVRHWVLDPRTHSQTLFSSTLRSDLLGVHRELQAQPSQPEGGWVSSWLNAAIRGRYHGGRRPSSDDSFHSPTVSILPSIMKRLHRRRTCSHTSPRRSPTMVTLHDTRFVECQWWNDGWTVVT